MFYKFEKIILQKVVYYDMYRTSLFSTYTGNNITWDKSFKDRKYKSTTVIDKNLTNLRMKFLIV